MALPNELTEALRSYLGLIIEEDLEKNRDHLVWLGENPHEPDRDLQIAETERAIELSTEALALFPLPPLPGEEEPRPEASA
jgi:hypothetical protein